jgi:hypothetical protein
MTNTQNRIFTLALAITAAAAVIWATWPKAPTNAASPGTSALPATSAVSGGGTGGMAALSDSAARARALAALGAASQSGLTQRPTLDPSAAPPGATTSVADPGADTDPSTNLPRVPHPAPKADDVLEMTIKQLGNFTYDAERGGEVPGDVRALDGTQVRLRGFMWPLGQATVLTDFVLVPSLTSCCFGQPPGVQHIITTRLPAKKAVPFVADEVWVQGTLRVKVVREEGYTSSIFELDATSVKLVGP